MVNNISQLLPYGILASHVIFGILILAFFFRKSWGKDTVNWVGKRAEVLALIVALSAVAGSLFYSDIVGFEPCPLCWWQRMFIFPTAVIFAVSVWKKLGSAFIYAVPLILIATLVAGYHSYYELGGVSILPCTAVGGACSRVYVMAFGYITIPVMSLTATLYILLIAWFKKLYDKNSNA